MNDLFDGIKSDIKQTVKLNSKKELLIYSYRVAGTVGLMMAKIFGEQDESAKMTIGSDEVTSNDINMMGSKHTKCSVSEIIIDKEKKLVTTPAYMEAGSIKEAAEGIEKLVKQVISMLE